MFIFRRRIGSKINAGKGEIAFNEHEQFFFPTMSAEIKVRG